MDSVENKEYKNLSLEKICNDLLNDPKRGHYAYNRTFKRALYDLSHYNDGEQYRFNEKLARAYIFIIEQMKHHKGKWAGTNLVLEWWQTAIIMIFFGMQRKNTEGVWVRRYRTGLIMIPRKSGKSTLLAAMAIADDILGGEAQNDICCFATKREQAYIIHDMLWFLSQSLPDDLKSVYRKAMGTIHKKDGGKFYTLGRDSKSSDGLNINMALSDEMHAFADNSLTEVVVSSQGARQNPSLLIATTAGFNMGSPLLTELDHAKEILDGYATGQDDERYFAFVSQVEEGTDPWSEEALWQSNPMMGISVDEDFLRAEQKDAENRIDKRVNFLTKHLNIFTHAAEIFIPREQYDKCTINTKEFDAFNKTEAVRCIIGLDLSIADDWTAINRNYIYENGRAQDGSGHLMVSKTDFYIPDEEVRERGKRLRIPLEAWIEQGYVKTLKGRVIDFDYIYNTIKESFEWHMERNIPVSLAYDPYSATQIVSRLQDDLNVSVKKGDIFVVNQGYSLNESLTLAKNKIMLESIKFKYSPPFAWNLASVVIQHDNYGRMRMDKQDRTKKIDGVAAWVNTLKQYIFLQDELTGSYNPAAFI